MSALQNHEPPGFFPWFRGAAAILCVVAGAVLIVNHFDEYRSAETVFQGIENRIDSEHNAICQIGGAALILLGMALFTLLELLAVARKAEASALARGDLDFRAGIAHAVSPAVPPPFGDGIMELPEAPP